MQVNNRISQDDIPAQLNLYKAAFDKSTQPIGIMDSYGNFLAVNNAFNMFFGMENDNDNALLSFFDCFAVSEHKRFENEIVPALSLAGIWSGEISAGHKKTHSEFLSVTCLLVGETGPNSLMIMNICPISNNINDFEDHRLFHLVKSMPYAVDNMLEGFAFFDVNGVLRRWNKTAEFITSVPASKIIGKNLEALMHGPSGQYIAGIIKRVISTGVAFAEKEFIYEELPFQGVYNIRIISADRGAIMFFADVSEEKKLQHQLLQAQKMQSIGVLTGGIAHDFNNLLTAIIGYSTMLKEKLPDGSREKHFAAVIEETGQRAESLAGQLLSFSRCGKQNTVNLDMNKKILKVLSLGVHISKRKISILPELSPEPCIVLGEPASLQQCFMNICINACDAMMPAGGELRIKTEIVTINDRVTLDAEGLMEPGKYVHIVFTDQGIGMDEHTLKHVFDPFFTTKGEGDGTGLGMCIILRIVKAHNGGIKVTSKKGAGTTVELYFPYAGAKEDELILPSMDSESVAHNSPLADCRKCVMVVDDEEIIGDFMKAALEKKGYEVIVESNGLGAIESLRDRKTKIDIVIMDMFMPGMDGLETFAELRKINPEINVILATGDFQDERKRERILKAGFRDVIQKPFRVNDIIEKIRNIGR